jgi:hypothetical protein
MLYLIEQYFLDHDFFRLADCKLTCCLKTAAMFTCYGLPVHPLL